MREYILDYVDQGDKGCCCESTLEIRVDKDESGKKVYLMEVNYNVDSIPIEITKELKAALIEALEKVNL